MKKAIRDISAIDIQRCIRGFLARKKRFPKLYATRLSQSSRSNSSHSVVDMKHLAELQQKHAEYEAQRKELKRLLKKFDDDFYRKHGVQPSKQDKEVRMGVVSTEYRLLISVIFS